MELYKELLVHTLAKKEIRVTFPGLTLNINKLIEQECYQALQEIKVIIEDNSLCDFMCIEEIVRIFERIGSNGGIRHDF